MAIFDPRTPKFRILVTNYGRKPMFLEFSKNRQKWPFLNFRSIFGDFAKTSAARPPVTRFCSNLHQNFCFFMQFLNMPKMGGGQAIFIFFAFMTSKCCHTSILHSNDPWVVLRGGGHPEFFQDLFLRFLAYLKNCMKKEKVWCRLEQNRVTGGPAARDSVKSLKMDPKFQNGHFQGFFQNSKNMCFVL